MTMDTIFIEGLRVPAQVGVYAWEMIAPQTLELSLEIGMPSGAEFFQNLRRQHCISAVAANWVCQQRAFVICIICFSIIFEYF